MANASNERPPADGARGPSLRQRAEAIAERLDLWSRAGGRAIPEAVLTKLERLIELSMRAAIYTVERARAAKPTRAAVVPVAETTAAPVAEAPANAPHERPTCSERERSARG